MAIEYFPYAYARTGQKELTKIAYEAFLNRRHVVVEGPNGLGKTASLLAAVLKFLEISDSVVFYYSRTHRQNENVVKELLRILKVKDHPNLIAVEVRGRSLSCSNKLVARLNESDVQSLCSFLKSIGACKYFLNTFSNKEEIAWRCRPANVFSHDAINKISQELMTCPYETAKLLVEKANLVVLTYPYFVNKFLREKLFFSLPRVKQKVAVFDECVGERSEVTTSNGVRSIREVVSRKGGSLLSVSLSRGSMYAQPVISKYVALGKVKARSTINLSFSNGSFLSVSERTPVLCLDNVGKLCWKKASDIDVGDKVISCTESLDFKPTVVEDVSADKNTDFYELLVPRFHNFIVNNIVVHNSHNLFTSLVEDNTQRITVEDLRRALLESTIYDDQLSRNIIEKILKILEMFSHEKNTEEDLHDFLKFLSREFHGIELFTVLNELERRGEQILRLSWAGGKNIATNVFKVASFMRRWISSFNSDFYFPILFRDETSHGLELLFNSPTEEGKSTFRNLSASVHVSGTLEPLEAYRATIGLPDEAHLHILPSPYNKENTLCVILKGYTSRFEERDDKGYEKLIEISRSLMDNIPGKVGLFLPSYEVLNKVCEFGFHDVNRTFFWEQKDESSQENLQLLNSFKKADVSQKATLITVAGGRSSEGVDFPEGEMDASIVMGIPFPKPTRRVKAIVSKLEMLFPEKGWCYGYLIPSLAKAVQAIGRAVRSPERKVVLILVDDRYEMPHIFKYLPAWFRSLVRSEKAYTVEEFIPVLRAFWQTIS